VRAAHGRGRARGGRAVHEGNELLKPLAEFPVEARGRIRGVLTDIDDTLTTHGRLFAAAYGALEKLRAAGMLVIPVTGRPAGWCDHIARMWPVDAVVGENGAFWFRHDAKAGKLVKHFVVGDAERLKRGKRLLAIARRILAEVPGCAIASDQPYRESDLAIDFREDVPEMPREEVMRIVAIMEDEGLTAKVSSIHVNGWFGGYDKLSTTRRMLLEDFRIDIDSERDTFVFAGDSPNDQPMFAFFPNAVGVANVLEMADLMTDFPQWITPSAGAAGFAELADALIPTR
jgi:HAD superfamily hydrolase (TIGR01484 family)